ncbi:MAG: hypothetical protein ACK47B_27295 [Armatimonadota bacterium]
MEQSYSPAAPPPPRIGDWLSESFRLFGQQWQVWLGQGFIYTLFALVPVLVGYAFFLMPLMAAVAEAERRGTEPSAAAIVAALTTGGAIFGLSIVVAVLASAALMVGMERTAAKQLRGEAIRVADIFSGGDVMLRMLGATLLVGLISGLGSIACVLPGLLLGGMLTFVTPLVAEGRMGVLDAMGKSWEVTKPYLWVYLVWFFLLALIGSIGSNLCVIGFAVTWPIYILGMMVAYRDVIGIPGALPPAPPPGVYPPYPHQ